MDAPSSSQPCDRRPVWRAFCWTPGVVCDAEIRQDMQEITDEIAEEDARRGPRTCMENTFCKGWGDGKDQAMSSRHSIVKLWMTTLEGHRSPVTSVSVLHKCRFLHPYLDSCPPPKPARNHSASRGHYSDQYQADRSNDGERSGIDFEREDCFWHAEDGNCQS